MFSNSSPQGLYQRPLTFEGTNFPPSCGCPSILLGQADSQMHLPKVPQKWEVSTHHGECHLTSAFFHQKQGALSRTRFPVETALPPRGHFGNWRVCWWFYFPHLVHSFMSMLDILQ